MRGGRCDSEARLLDNQGGPVPAAEHQHEQPPASIRPATSWIGEASGLARLSMPTYSLFALSCGS